MTTNGGANPPSAVLFVGNLAWDLSEDDVWSHFGEHGEVSSVRLPKDMASGRPKGFGYVEFASPADAQKAFDALSGSELSGREIRLDFSIPRDQQTPRSGQDQADRRAKSFNDQRSAASNILFVGNLAFEASEDDIWALFGEHGEVSSVRLPKDPESGRAKGYGYVEFAAQDAAEKALAALTGHELSGRPLRLDYSAPRDQNGGGGRGGGRGGFGGGRGGGRGDRKSVV